MAVRCVKRDLTFFDISKIEDYSGVAGNDVDVFYMALRTSF